MVAKSVDLEHLIGSVAEAAHVAACMMEKTLHGNGEPVPGNSGCVKRYLNKEDEAGLSYAVYAVKQHARELQRLYYGEPEAQP